MNIITTIGFIFSALAWSCLATRYLGKGDKIGGIIFFVTVIISAVLFLRNLHPKKIANK